MGLFLFFWSENNWSKGMGHFIMRDINRDQGAYRGTRQRVFYRKDPAKGSITCMGSYWEDDEVDTWTRNKHAMGVMGRESSKRGQEKRCGLIQDNSLLDSLLF